jgi:hypothetical protein
VKGEWPSIRMAQGQGYATGGPTGAPSNGWLVRLTRTQKPSSTVWVAADPPKSNEIVPLSRHLVAVADGAAHGACRGGRVEETGGRRLLSGALRLERGQAMNC